ncbi:hypothetical protein NCS57_01439100 [Fusarium keratoplasticum]|uniref:Uncharacterized protein n=1 Tax=Fusarium keratoplasticum TaxID=1328300 RepID=A0ACC0QGP2_9HYPO|nr:hypothetical protein NCS57_01439100 [Fusarium keratoplasticum]KAI8651034.1 hypothetical protein NCS57_01439100 [Fusarium keratoplasticum]KAI8651811.1 hypothetical protein NCS55_01427600 [Fusarium keratoplasticum]
MTPINSEFHTHHATPHQLFRELRSILGDDARFKVEMRHNIYNIETDQDLDLDALYNRCKRRRRRVPRISTSTGL